MGYCTLRIVSFPLALMFLPHVFVVLPWRRLLICSFVVLSRGVVLIGFKTFYLPSSSMPLRWTSVTYFMDYLKLTFVQFLRFFVIFLTCVSSSSGLKVMTFVFAPSDLVLSALFAPSRLGCISFFPFSFVFFVLLDVVGFFISNGVLMGLLHGSVCDGVFKMAF